MPALKRCAFSLRRSIVLAPMKASQHIDCVTRPRRLTTALHSAQDDSCFCFLNAPPAGASSESTTSGYDGTRYKEFAFETRHVLSILVPKVLLRTALVCEAPASSDAAFTPTKTVSLHESHVTSLELRKRKFASVITLLQFENVVSNTVSMHMLRSDSQLVSDKLYVRVS